MWGFDYLIAALFLVYLIWRRAPILAYLVPLGVFIITTALKGLFSWPRPNGLSLDAFPSGHAAFFLTLSLVVYYLNRSRSPAPTWKQGFQIFFFATAFIIGVARVALGLHYPSDILAGFLLAYLLSFAYRKYL